MEGAETMRGGLSSRGGRPIALRLGLQPARPRPIGLVALVLSSGPIASLLVYFAGWCGMPAAFGRLALPSIAGLALVAAARGEAARATRDRILLGLWSGGVATAAYDVVRVPLAWSGAPVFKAISYFGTILLDVPRPTPASEVVGWAYHLSTGVGFAMMYCLLVRRPGWLGAVVWGVGLEVAMLLTPYAEVFGYKRSLVFVATSLSAHVVYGLGLWGATRAWPEPPPAGGAAAAGARPRALLWLAGPLVVALVAIDFHRLHARTIPVSPPADLGPGLYVTWNVPEPDRIGALWAMRRFTNPGARFFFVEPMSSVRFGTPFDIPEADVRRSINRSAFESVLLSAGRTDDPALQPLRRLCYLTEIQPWALASDPEAQRLASALGDRLGDCRDLARCLDAGIGFFEETYRASPPAAR